MITKEDLSAYLGIDYIDSATDLMLGQSLSAASDYIANAVCDPLPDEFPSDPLIDQLILMVASDFFESRGTSAKEVGASRRMYQSMIQQLQVKYSNG